MNSSRRVTITDIAARAGVSIGTVSFALNDRPGIAPKTKKRILSIADEMGWAPSRAARSLAEAKAETFGLILTRDPHHLGVESFYMQFLAGIEKVLGERDYGLLLQVVPTREAELEALEKWRRSQRVDGVILVDVEDGDPRIELSSRPGALPAVAVCDPSVAGALTCVWTDDAASMRAAVAHLQGLGHRRIARVAGPEILAHSRIRDEAFLAAARDAVVVHTDYSPEAGAAATRELIADGITALVYDNDVMAVAGMSAAREMGISVPGDVSMIAWDDSVLCQYLSPAVTALSHDVVAFGAHVARRLFDLVDGAERGVFWDSTPELVVRASTAPAG